MNAQRSIQELDKQLNKAMILLINRQYSEALDCYSNFISSKEKGTPLNFTFEAYIGCGTAGLGCSDYTRALAKFEDAQRWAENWSNIQDDPLSKIFIDYAKYCISFTNNLIKKTTNKLEPPAQKDLIDKDFPRLNKLLDIIKHLAVAV